MAIWDKSLTLITLLFYPSQINKLIPIHSKGLCTSTKYLCTKIPLLKNNYKCCMTFFSLPMSNPFRTLKSPEQGQPSRFTIEDNDFYQIGLHSCNTLLFLRTKTAGCMSFFSLHMSNPFGPLTGSNYNREF